MRATPGGEERAATVRLRAIAPVLAFAAPAVLLVIGGVVSAAKGDDAARAWIAAASPVTAVVLATRDAGERTLGLLTLLITAVASAPLWALLSVVVSRRVMTFAAFWRQYLACAVAWAVVAVLMV